MIKLRKHTICYFLLFACILLGEAQDCTPEIIWEKSYGFSNDLGGFNNGAEAIIELSNGDIVFAGGTNLDVFIVKTDATGNVIWNKTFGGSDDDSLRDMIQTEDNGFLLLASSKSSDGDVPSNAGDNDYWLFKLDAAGNMLWSKTYGGAGNDVPESILPYYNQYVIAGNSTSSDTEMNVFNTNGNSNALFSLVNENGNQFGSTRIGYTEFHVIKDMTRSADGDGYILAGYYSETLNSQKHTVLTKFNQFGFYVWDEVILSTQNNLTPNSIEPTTDNGFILTGFNPPNMFVLKTNSAGQEAWRKTIGGSYIDIGTKAFETENSGFLLLGTGASDDGNIGSNHNPGSGKTDIIVAQLDPLGEITWIKNFGGTDTDYATAMTITSNNTYLIAGDAWSTDIDVTNNDGNRDTWIFELNPCEVDFDIPCDPIVIWDRTFGTDVELSVYPDETAESIHELPNGNFAFAGRSLYNTWFKIIDPNGNPIVSETYVEDRPQSFSDMKPTPDGGFVILYRTRVELPNDPFETNVGVRKLNAAGITEWVRNYGGTGAELPTEIIVAKDGGFVILADTESDDGDLAGTNLLENIWVLKLTENGDIIWSKKFGAIGNDLPGSLTNAHGDGYVITNAVSQDVNGTRYLSVFELDFDGNLIWQNYLDDAATSNEFPNTIPRYITQTQEGGYIITGTSSFNAGLYNIDAMGQTIWRNYYSAGNVAYPNEVHQAPDGGFIIGAYAFGEGNDVSDIYGNRWDIWIFKTDIAGNLIWEKNFGGTDEDFLRSLKITSDNNLIVAGYTESDDIDVTDYFGGEDAWVFKISCEAEEEEEEEEEEESSCDNNIIWEKNYGNNNIQDAIRIFEVENGNYAFGGDDGADVWLNKLDNIGNVIWEETYGGENTDYFKDMKPTPDGGFVVLIESFYTVPGAFNQADFLILKVDSNGQEQWTRRFGGSERDKPEAIIVADDGGYVVLGEVKSTDGDLQGTNANENVCVLKLDTNGAILWTKKFGLVGQDIADCLVNAHDDGYMIATAARLTFNGIRYVSIFKLDVNGNLISQNYLENIPVINAETIPKQIIQTQDGGYMMIGNSTFKISLFKLSATGVEEWSNTYGGSGLEAAGEIVQTPDGGFVFAGTAGSSDGDVENMYGVPGSLEYRDFWIVQTDSIGNIIWERNYGGTDREFARSIKIASDGNFIVCGSSESNDLDISNAFGQKDAWIIKVESCFEPVDCSQVSTEIQASQNFICGNESITLNAGNGFATYNWSDGTAGQIRNITTAGTYEVIATDFNGCKDTTNIEITQFTPPTVFILNQPEYCAGGKANLGAPAGFASYIWSNGATTNATVADTPGLYTVTVTDANGCTGTSSTLIVQNPNPVVNLSTNDNDFCVGDTIELFAGIHTSYSWSTGSMTPSIAITLPGNYQVTVTAESGCTDSDAIEMTTFPIPTPSFESNNLNFCINDTIALQLENTFANYLWSNGSNNETINITSGGNYSVTVTDLNNCRNSTQVDVATNPLPTLDLSNNQNSFCENDSLTITANSNANTFIWSNGSTNASTNITSPGNYTVTVTDFNNCMNTADWSVEQNPIPNIVFINSTYQFCYENELTLNLNTTFDDYVWSDQSTENNLVVDESGTYSVTATNAFGCTNSLATTVTEGFEIIADAGEDQFFTCTDSIVTIGGSNSTSNPDFSYEWTNFNGDILGNELTLEVSDAAVYTLTIFENSTGCSESSSVAVTTNTFTPIANISGNTQIDCDNSTITLNGFNPINPPNLSYEWTDEVGNLLGESSNLEVSNAGTFQLVVTYLENGCSDVTTHTIIENTGFPTASIEVMGEFDCGENTVELNANQSSTGSNFAYEWYFENTDTPLLSNGLTLEATQPGTYILVVNNLNNNCNAITQVILNPNETTPDFSIDLDNDGELTCDINTISITTSSNESELTYEWLNDQNETIASSPMIDLTIPGNYQVIGTGMNGCSTTVDFSITQSNLSLTAIANASGYFICDNSSVTLSANGSSADENIEYNWFNPNEELIGSGELIDVQQTGIFTLTVANNITGCSAQATIEVEASPAIPNATFEILGTLNCGTPTIILDGSNSTYEGVYSIVWTDDLGNELGTTPQLTVSNPGSYILTATNNETSCTSSVLQMVNANFETPEAIIEAPEMLTCINQQIILDASNSSSGSEFEYQWQNENNILNEVGNSLEVNEPGIYTLQITNIENSCVDEVTLEVFENSDEPVAFIEVPETITCSNSTVTLDASNSSQGDNFIYQWENIDGVLSETGNALTTNEAGVYILRVTNSENGCTHQYQVEVIQSDALPDVIIETPSLLTCTQNEITLDGSNSTQGDAFIYQWSDANGVVSENVDVLQVTAAGSYTLQITNTETGCVASSTVQVIKDADAPQAIIEAPEMLTCINEQIILDASNSSSGSEFEYQWQDENNILNEVGNSLEVNEPGTYTLQITNTENSCVDEVTLEVLRDTIAPIAIIETPIILTCTNESTILNGTSSSAGNDIQYSWTDEMDLTLGSTPSLNVSNPGFYTLEVINEANGCVSSAIQEVLQDVEIPIANAGDDFQIPCNPEDLILLDGEQDPTTTDLSYLWSSANGNLISNPTILNPEINTSDLYTLLVTDTTNGCTNADDVLVTQAEGIQAVNFDSESPECLEAVNGFITISEVVGGTAPFQYAINDEPFSDNSNFDNLDAGDYTVHVLDLNNCEWSEVITIESPTAFELTIESNVIVVAGSDYLLSPQTDIPTTEIESITWTPSTNLSCTDCLNPVARPSETAVYQLEIITLNGCSYSTSITLAIDDQEIKVWELLSPYNVDGKNDDWTIENIDNFSDNTVTVFNRWGDIVYEAAPYSNNNPWKGTNKNGKLLPTGTYYFLIKYDLADTKVLKGRLVIVE